MIWEVVFSRYHCEDDTPWVGHVLGDEIRDQLYIMFSLMFVVRVYQARKIYDGELRLGGPRDLDSQNVFGESVPTKTNLQLN